MHNVVTQTDFPKLKKISQGKVRDIYEVGESLLLVTTDRISAFDVILPDGIPQKGAVLNHLSAFWFDHFRDLCPNHVITIDVNEMPEEVQAYADVLQGRSVLAKKAEAFPIECVARGYIVGSGWKDYQASGEVCGIKLPTGLQNCNKLEEPIFTPATKAVDGHDENISFDRMADIIGLETANILREKTLEIYMQARNFAAGKGIIIADTKLEWGVFEDSIILIDEVLTPDSSRFWPADAYTPGKNQASFDKQFVRDFLETLEWDKTPPGPTLPERIIQKTSAKYLEAYKRLTGRSL